jgi:hypothetical protein
MWLAGPCALWLISMFNSCMTKYLYLSAKEVKISAQKLSYGHRLHIISAAANI